jgi:tetratricopeptide (TPR) repeat protein
MRESSESFDINVFLTHLDELFDTKQTTTAVEPYLFKSIDAARAAADKAAELTILNEFMGFYRSQSMHGKGVAATQEALNLVKSMGIEGTEAATTTLINAATEYRAAGRYDTALALYQEALASSAQTLESGDATARRKLAALHNNLSIAYSDLQQFSKAQEELETALTILTSISPDPATDIDVGSTHANLALVCFSNGQPDAANEHTAAAMRIFEAGKHEDASHFSSALAAAGETFFHMDKFADSVAAYERALDLIRRSYGTDNDYYAITAQNLAAAKEAAEGEASGAGRDATGAGGDGTGDGDGDTEDVGGNGAQGGARSAGGTGGTASAGNTDTASAHVKTTTGERADISGLQLSRLYWEQFGKPMLEEKYPQLRSRIAAGLVGHGSEAYGFDDVFSRDHDFAPRFCLWLTPEDYAQFGEQLQHDYDALPAEFMGYSRAKMERTPRSLGSRKRDGVFSIPDFYASLTGYASAPKNTEAEAVQWLLIDEATLAAATNGEVFADSLGAFSRARGEFKAMPDDVRLSLISRRLGMLSQTGQYNFPRMIARGQREGAWRALNEFVRAAASMVFLINGPSAVGYLPYYKWEMAALKRLSARMGTRLAQVAELLENIMTLSSAACFPDADSDVSTAPLGNYSQPGAHAVAADHVYDAISEICALVRDEILREGLTTSRETFLEWQRPYVEEGISNPQLRSL